MGPGGGSQMFSGVEDYEQNACTSWQAIREEDYIHFGTKIFEFMQI